MSKTCPNCGVNSPDNAKFCIECAESLEGVPINKEEEVKKTPPTSDSNGGGSVIPCIIGIIIVVVIVIAAASFIFNSGGENAQKNVTVTFGDVQVSSAATSSGVTNYYYSVSGFFSNFPDNLTISLYSTPNYLNVDHVTVQIIKDGAVLNEYKSTMNTNKLTQSPNTPANNSSK